MYINLLNFSRKGKLNERKMKYRKIDEKIKFQCIILWKKKRMAPFGPFIKAHALAFCFSYFIQFVRGEAYWVLKWERRNSLSGRFQLYIIYKCLYIKSNFSEKGSRLCSYDVRVLNKKNVLINYREENKWWFNMQMVWKIYLFV